MKRVQRLLAVLLTVCFANATMIHTVQASLISTEQVARAAGNGEAESGHARLAAMLARADVQAEMERQGLNTALAAERIFAPLGVEDATYLDVFEGPPREVAARCVSTGHCDWRGRVLHGTVNDQNAAAMGGIAPHAGLFATARAVHRLAAEWVAARDGRGKVLDRRLVAEAWDRDGCAAGGAASTWALGWDTPHPDSSAGDRLSPRSFGHTGFTGTSMWIDPERSLFVILLTNRVHPTRENNAIRGVRRALADAVVDALARP